MSKMLDAALAYAERGWAIFPCRIDKRPFTEHGVFDATTDKRKVRAFWTEHPNANIGFAVGEADMMTLDLDPGWSEKELEDAVGPIPKTKLLCRTPRGGWHKYLSISRDEQVAASASKLAPHVDVRSANSYTLLPPSRTKDGEYTWESQGTPAYRTDAILKAANAAVTKSENWDEWTLEPDQPHHIEEAIVWLREKAEIAVEGQGGDLMAFKTAAAMKSFGISMEQAQELIWDHWNPRCSPPWKASDVDHLNQKIINGYSYNAQPPGNWTSEYRTNQGLEHAFLPVVTDIGDGKEWTAGKFRIVSRAGMSGIRPPEWLIRDFLPDESYAIIFGAPGTFKTFVALDIALSVATGFISSDKAMWSDLAGSGNVLFAAGEGRASITQRVAAWENTHLNGTTVDKFYLADPVPLISEPVDTFIENALLASPSGYKLVILDTVGRAMQGVNENAQEHASSFTNLVQAIQKRLGASVLALHHVGHGDTSRARGSSVFGADADTIIKLERKDKGAYVSLAMVKQKDAAEWETKRWIKMNGLSLGEEDSLAAIKCPPEEVPNDKAENGLAIMSAVMSETIAFLKKYPDQARTSGQVAEYIVAGKKVDLKMDTIRTDWLPKLRDATGTQAARCWDADAKKWQFVA